MAWMPRLWSLLRQLKPDLVHTRNLSALEAQFVAVAAGVRARVHGEHGRDVFDLHGRNWKYNLLRRAARPLVSSYIAVSQDLAVWLRDTIRVPARKINQIYNGVDCVKFHARGAERPGVLPPGFVDGNSVVFGSVGRMAEVKDYHTLARAFVSLLHNKPEAARRARLVIVGEGVSREACRQLLADAGVAALAWLPGERHDIADVMRALDVFVLPSLNEGISNTILEAQASGLPVIATAVGGNVELVEAGVNGLLVRPGDADGLAQALLTYFEHPALRERHGREARARVEARFSIPAMVRAYEAVYEKALAKTGRHG
jgi:sugar transferase (PEP-CTERM/EpsH1 system associated)